MAQQSRNGFRLPILSRGAPIGFEATKQSLVPHPQSAIQSLLQSESMQCVVADDGIARDLDQNHLLGLAKRSGCGWHRFERCHTRLTKSVHVFGNNGVVQK
mgnify:CR=1 FL=1